jgi:hypothetical protein
MCSHIDLELRLNLEMRADTTSSVLPTPRRTICLESPSGRLSWCVLCRSKLFAPLRVEDRPGPLHRGLVRMPLTYGFVLEIHSLLHRILIRRRQRYGAFFLIMSSVRQKEDQPRPKANIRRCACIRDIESFVEAHPWATILDLEMYRDAWQAGAAWAEDNSCNADRA